MAWLFIVGALVYDAWSVECAAALAGEALVSQDCLRLTGLAGGVGILFEGSTVPTGDALGPAGCWSWEAVIANGLKFKVRTPGLRNEEHEL